MQSLSPTCEIALSRLRYSNAHYSKEENMSTTTIVVIVVVIVAVLGIGFGGVLPF
ncbi:hypothetical protein HZU72_19540 [Halomonas sp. QX-2]|uniref:Uncharacterized protein n=1 Tax=Vreelandella sedimenti TaxID=2729618 RepID=A0A7Z0SRH9_9GAMM|nr:MULTISPECIES: hypothetical protein [Halomonas]NYT74589.1 hypothetical protein [Halomonas sedimenti]